MSLPFYYDYFSLRYINPEKWHSDFFWPVPWATTQRINEDFRKFHVELINRLGDSFEGDCLLIAYHISGRFIEVANHYLAIQYLVEKGYHIHPSPYLKLIPLLQQKGKIDFKNENLLNERYNFKILLRNLHSSLKFNFSRCQYNLLKQLKPESIASSGVISHELLKNKEEWIKLITAGWLLKDNTFENKDISSKYSDTFKYITMEFVKFFTGYMNRNFNLSTPENINNALTSFSFHYLIKTGQVYFSLLRSVGKLKIKNFFSSTAGNPYTRALSLAVKKNGGNTTGFPHGYFICHHSGTRPSFHEFATVDNFVAYTKGSISLFERNVQYNPLPRKHRISFLCDNTNFFTKLKNSWNLIPIPKKNKTIMVLELSLIPEWAGYYAAEAMVNYHFYYSLCKSLSKAGYNIIFKKRPKNLSWQGINIFEHIPNVRVIYEPFEKPGVIEQCDAVIIQYAHSSTFNYSICTNKTVIYVDSGWEPWFPDVYASMKKRCRILHCHYDNLNRPCFDENELFEILNMDCGQIDTEYFDKYLS